MSPDQRAPADVEASSSPAVANAASLAVVSPPALMAVLADPLRWRILTLLPMPSCEQRTYRNCSAPSRRWCLTTLKVLREAGSVLTAPCGRFTYYRLRPGALDELAETVSALAVASRCDVAKRPC